MEFKSTPNTRSLRRQSSCCTLGPDDPPEASASPGTSAILLGVSGRGNSLLGARLTACHANTWHGTAKRNKTRQAQANHSTSAPRVLHALELDSIHLPRSKDPEDGTMCAQRARTTPRHTTTEPMILYTFFYHKRSQLAPHLQTLLVGHEHQPSGLVHTEARCPPRRRDARQRAIGIQIVRR